MSKKDGEICEFCEEVQKANTKSLASEKKLTKTGWMILGGSGLVLGLVYAVATPFVLPALRKYCLPYVPATNAQVQNVFQALTERSGSLIDLGSGDGRIVVAAAARGFKAIGVELNPWLIWYSRIFAWRSGQRQTTKFIRKDLWKVDLSKQSNIVIFGVEQMMESLAEKISKEVNQDCRIVACRFPLPNWTPIMTIGHGIDTVWLYERP